MLKKKQYKIAVIVDQLVAGGVQKAAIEEVRWLNKLGFEAELLILMHENFNKKFLDSYPNIPHKIISDKYPLIFKKSFKFPFFHFFSTLHLISPLLAPFTIKKAEYDLIISHGTPTTLTAFSLLIFRKIPYFFVVHDPSVYILDKIYTKTGLRKFLPIFRPVISLVEKNIIQKAKVCFVDSKVHARFLKKHYQISPQVLYLGVNTPKFLGDYRKTYFLSLTRWDFGKNPSLILELAEKLDSSRFVIAGSWTSLKEYEKFKLEIRKRGLKNRVKLIVNLKETDLSKLFQEAIAFVHPHFEAFGLGALEAAANGIPPVIPIGSGITEILENQKEGLFPDSDKVNDFINILEKFVNDPSLTSKIGKNSYHKACKFSWQIHTQKLASQIQKYLQKKQVKVIILENAHTNEHYLAGGDILLEKLVTRLPEKFKIEVITTEFGSKHWHSKTKHLLNKNMFDMNSNPFKVFLSYILRTWQSTKILMGINPDLIISTTDIFPDVIPAFLFKIKKPKTRWISWVHHLLPTPDKRPGNKLVNLFAWLAQISSIFTMRVNANLIICRNKDVFSSLSKTFPKSRLKIIDTGVDFYKVYKHKIHKKYYFDAIFIGRLHWQKGVFDLPKIWVQVIAELPDSKLAIIGSSTKQNLSLLKSAIKKTKTEKNIAILGNVTDDEKLDILKSAKIFLFCDYEAGFSLAVAEAMAAKVPVIGYSLPIFGSVYKKGFVKVPIGNTENMARETIKILKNPGLAQKIAEDGIEQARLLDQSKTARDFLKILNDKTQKN